MSVSDGQIANAATFNNAFMSRINDTSTSGSVAVGGNIKASVQTGLVAFAGGGQASATQITKDNAFVQVVASNGDSLKLPPSVAGLKIQVFNQGANTAAVFPSLGEQIDGLAANTSVSVPTGDGRIFTCSAIGLWYSDSSVQQEFDDLSPTTTKGDLITRDASTNVRLPVGADGQALVADSAQATGLKYAAVGDVSGPVTVSDNAIAVFDGTSGKVIKESLASIDLTGRGVFYGLQSTNEGVRLPEIATPSTPASGTGLIYFKSDGKPYSLNDSGVETDLTDATGTTQITARAHTSSQSLANDVETQVSFTTEEYDAGADLSATTFTAPDTDYYHIDCGLAWSSNASNSRYMILKKNGSATDTKIETTSAGNSFYQSISRDIFLTSGDTIDLYARQNSGGNLSFDGSSMTFLNIHKIK